MNEEQQQISEEQKETLRGKSPKLYQLFFGDKQSTSDQLLIASLYMMAFECLKDYAEECFRTFYCTGYTSDDDGNIKEIEPANFKEIKKKYAAVYREQAMRLMDEKIDQPSIFQTAIAFFYEKGGLTDDDMKQVIVANKIRNDFAHELYKWLLDDSIPSLNRNSMYGPLDIYFTLSNWWIKNFEAAIIPEQYENYSEEDMNGGMAFNVQMLLQVVNKVLPEVKS